MKCFSVNPHVNIEWCNFRTKQSPGKKSASRGRSRQRKTKKDEDDEEGV